MWTADAYRFQIASISAEQKFKRNPAHS